MGGMKKRIASIRLRAVKAASSPAQKRAGLESLARMNSATDSTRRKWVSGASRPAVLYSTKAFETRSAAPAITAAPDVEGHMPFPRPEVPEGEDEEEALPPDPEKAAADWAQRASNMTPESAWQSGVAIADHQLPETLDELPLESRHDVYLRIRSRLGAQAPDLELEALATRQGTALAMQQATA